MRISKIRLKNYGPYFGEQIIEIPNNERKIVILRGENGAGKTNFVNSLIWCLYDERKSLEKIVNDKILYDVENNIVSDETMYVEIHFNHECLEHTLKKEIKIQKKNNRVVISDPTTILTKYSNAQIVETIEDPLEVNHYINTIINEAVKSYFFFDGARIENFTKDEHNKDVENAIKKLLKIEAIIRAKDHIEVLVSEYRKKIAQLDQSDMISNLNDEIEEMKNRIRSLNSELLNSSREISSHEKNIYLLESAIEQAQSNSIYKNQKNELLLELSYAEEELKKLNIDIGNLLKISPILFADKLFADSINFLREKNKSDGIPARYLKEMFRKSIESKKCIICETKFDYNYESMLMDKKLIELCSSSVDDNFNFSILEELVENQKIRLELNQNIIKKMEETSPISSKIEKLNNRIALIEAKINKELPDVTTSKVFLEERRREKDELVRKNESLKIKKLEVENKLTIKEKEYGNIETKNIEARYFKEKISVGNRIKKELEHIYEIYEKDEIESINCEIFSIFTSIIRKSDSFIKVFVDENYRLNVKREYSDDNILNQLSYGERQILSLSLILSLAKISGDLGAFVMDTPMGNLDPLHRQKLLRNLPLLVGQLFLLVTSSEFTRDLYDLCHNEIAVSYLLKSNDRGQTQIIKEEM